MHGQDRIVLPRCYRVLDPSRLSGVASCVSLLAGSPVRGGLLVTPGSFAPTACSRCLSRTRRALPGRAHVGSNRPSLIPPHGKDTSRPRRAISPTAAGCPTATGRRSGRTLRGAIASREPPLPGGSEVVLSSTQGPTIAPMEAPSSPTSRAWGSSLGLLTLSGAEAR
jgi:hypothetical protein